MEEEEEEGKEEEEGEEEEEEQRENRKGRERGKGLGSPNNPTAGKKHKKPSTPV